MNIFRFLEQLLNPDYYEETPIKKSSSHKEYNNKNSNIEYYTDEKGNIRRRRKNDVRNVVAFALDLHAERTKKGAGHKKLIRAQRRKDGKFIMKYIRTKDGITTSDKVTHELIEDIYCSGYLRTLKKSANVRIGEEWSNFYGRWVDIIDENGCHYSIKPSEVERVTKELPQAEDIVELCDEIVLIENGNEHNIVYLQEAYDRIDEYHNQDNYEPRLIGRIKVGLDKKAVAEWKENEQGLYDWVLL